MHRRTGFTHLSIPHYGVCMYHRHRGRWRCPRYQTKRLSMFASTRRSGPCPAFLPQPVLTYRWYDCAARNLADVLRVTVLLVLLVRLALRHSPFGSLPHQWVFEVVGALPPHRVMFPLRSRLVFDVRPPPNRTKPSFPQPFALFRASVVPTLPLVLRFRSPVERQVGVLIWWPLPRRPRPLRALLAVRNRVRVLLPQKVPVDQFWRKEERVKKTPLLLLPFLLLVSPPLGVQRVPRRLSQELTLRLLRLPLPWVLLVGGVRGQDRCSPK